MYTSLTARPSENGRLTASGTDLVDSEGNAVQLRGVSTHGLAWYPDYINNSLFKEVSADWNCNLIRLAMYSELYCDGEKKENLKLMKKGIDAAIKADMYVLVDWHILADDDPNINVDEVIEFFDMIDEEYKDSPNLLFEICNEPNGTTNWGDVLKYSNKFIPVIRKHI